MTTALSPLSSDPETARRFARRALAVRGGEGREPPAWAEAFERRLAEGSIEGRLWVDADRPLGLVCWSPGGPLGLAVRLLYSAAEGAAPERYGELLTSVEGEIGPVVFLPGPLAGLASTVEEAVLTPRGYRRFSRSEMTWEPTRARPRPPDAGDERQRPATRDDLASLAGVHRRAYRRSLDRYLFLEVEDEELDALRAVREILDGRWGELLDAGSWVAERDGEIVGLVLTVRTDDGALIADVAVEPRLQGTGIARRLLGTAVRSVRAAGADRIYLNVTEGNRPAVRLYQGLGFTRSLGPSLDWYNGLRIPLPSSVDERGEGSSVTP